MAHETSLSLIVFRNMSLSPDEELQLLCILGRL